jgi:hypothetical protein
MNWRKQTGILLAALLALLALAACGGEATPAPTPAAVLTLATPAEAPAAAPTAAPAEAPTETAMPETAPEAATEATGATAMDAISDEDFALFQQVGQAATERMMTRLHEMCPEANDGRTFPLAEPDYNAKRPLDLSAFADALATFDPARGAELDALLAGKTIPELQTLLDSGELTSVELVTYYVDRIQRYDVDRLNSVIELNPQALADAAAADVARSEGKLLGPLHGIPVLFKDNIATGGGMHTTAGAFALKDWQPDRDAFLVQQLHAAGALIFGKANLSEWLQRGGWADAQPPRRPRDLRLQQRFGSFGGGQPHHRRRGFRNFRLDDPARTCRRHRRPAPQPGADQPRLRCAAGPAPGHHRPHGALGDRRGAPAQCPAGR